MFRNMLMGLGMVQLFSWGLGVIMFGALIGLGTGGMFTSDTVEDMRTEYAKKQKERQTDAWYRASGDGKVPSYGRDEYGRKSKREMGEPTLDLEEKERYRSYDY